MPGVSGRCYVTYDTNVAAVDQSQVSISSPFRDVTLSQEQQHRLTAGVKGLKIWVEVFIPLLESVAIVYNKDPLQSRNASEGGKQQKLEAVGIV